MAVFEYGPVEFILAGFPGEHPGPAVAEAIAELVESGTVNLLDLVFVTRSAEGEITVVELEEILDEEGFADFELQASGIAADEDIEAIAEEMPLGSSAILIVAELVFAKKLAQSLFNAGGSVLHSERVPAPVVNAALEAATTE
ncbi:DUF6325 family protein [Compostimonas suwonensis]|uniref:Uncharacterized protein n=1 Tax=Compostimonas suwonensis TaxID=1048394 RepID=A0A2M9C4L8_9MICO|nr:DUF6325 family protein [Compostimonas suwonensis]PJJ65480.1 hypothetical protein CLV54_0513 [Compostimonas suwonensis]